MSPTGTTVTGNSRGSTEHHSSTARCWARARATGELAGHRHDRTAGHVRARERVEHELAREAEQVERARAIVVDERSGRDEVLAQHDLRLVFGAVLGITVSLPDLLQIACTRLVGGSPHVREARPDGGIEVGMQPVGLFHDVGVGVVRRTALV